MPNFPVKRIAMLCALILAFFSPLYAQNTQDCSGKTCSGVGPPQGICKAGDGPYSQVDSAGSIFTCSGLPPVWTALSASDAQARAMATAAVTTANTASTTANNAAAAAANSLQVQPVGLYNASTAYAKGSFVKDSAGNRYLALQATTGNAPSATGDTAYWTITSLGSASPAGSTTGQIFASTGAGNPPTVLTAAQQRTSDGALQVLKEVADLPMADVTSTSSSWYTTSSCTNAADPLGNNDSSCAIQAAIVYASKIGAQTSNTQTAPVVYFPPGNYKFHGVHDVPGVSIRCNGMNTTFTLNDPYAPLIVVGGALPAGASAIGGTGQATHTVIEGCKFQGQSQATTGTLLEMDTAFGVLKDDIFSSNGGYGVVYEAPGERQYGANLGFYNLLGAMMFAGDNNESTFFEITGLANGKSNSGYCYGNDECTNGSFPAAGTASNPTLLYPNTHGMIEIHHGVNIAFIGGDMKDNTYEAAFKVVDSIGVKVDGTYVETEPDGLPWPQNGTGLILEGPQPRTTITGATTTSSVGGYTITTWPVSTTNWFPETFGSLADVLAQGSYNQFQPVVIIPSDYVTGSTTASATCPGINKGQLESLALTFAVNGASPTFDSINRNSNGVYNSTSNVTGVPAAYNWSGCSAPPTIELATPGYPGAVGQGAAVDFRGHLQPYEGTTAVQNGYQWVQGWGAGPDYGGIVMGVSPNAPKTGLAEYYPTKGTAGDPAATVPSLLWLEPASDIQNAQDIHTIGTARITINYGQQSPDAPWIDPFAFTPDTANGGSFHVYLTSATGVGNLYVDPVLGSNATDTVLQVPAIGWTYDSRHGIYHRDCAYYNNYSDYSPYVSGTCFMGDFNIAALPGSSAGNAKGVGRFHAYGPEPGSAANPTANDGADVGFSFDQYVPGTQAYAQKFTVDVSNNLVTSNAVFTPAGGVVWPIANFNNSAAYNLAVGQVQANYQPTGAGPNVVTLAAPQQGGTLSLFVFATPTTPVTITPPSGILLILNNTQFSNGNPLVLNNYQGFLNLAEGVNYYSANTAQNAMPATLTAGSGFTITPAVGNTWTSGSFTATNAAAGTANAAVVTLGFNNSASNTPQPTFCEVSPSGTTGTASPASAVMTDLFWSGYSHTSVVLNQGATGWTPATYAFTYRCAFVNSF